MDLFCSFWDFVKSRSGTTAIACLSFIIAFANLMVTFHNLLKNRFKIKIDINSVRLFKSPDNSCGNIYALTFPIKITNKSSSPVNVSDIQLYRKKKLISSCEKGKIDYRKEFRDGNSHFTVEFEKCSIKIPDYISPFGETSGQVLFFKAGSNYTHKSNTVKIKVVTSRGNVTRKIKISTYEFGSSVLVEDLLN